MLDSKAQNEINSVRIESLAEDVSELAETAIAAQSPTTILEISKSVLFLFEDFGNCRIVYRESIEEDSALIGLVKDIAKISSAIREPVILPKLSNEKSAFAALLVSNGVESLVCIPFKVESSITKVYVAMFEKAREFSDLDVQEMQIIASQTPVLTEGKSFTGEGKDAEHPSDTLFDLTFRKIRELTAVNKVSEAVGSTLDIEKLLELSLENGLRAVGADSGSLMLINPDTKRLEIAAAKGISEKIVKETSSPIGKGIAGYVAKNAKSVLVSDARTDVRFNISKYRDEIKSSASVPLVNRGQVIGVLNANTINPLRRFDRRHLLLLETVANQIAVAIVNGQLHARVIRRTSQLDSLLQITKTITSTLNLDVVLRRLSDEICSLFSMECCAILLVDNLTGRLKYGYGSGLETKDRHVYVDLALPLATRVRKNGNRIMKSDISKSSVFRNIEVARYEFKGAVSLPLRYAGKLVAVATAFTTQLAVFPQSVKDIARALPDFAGAAITNARAYRKKYKIAQIVQSRLTPRGVTVSGRVDIGLKFVSAGEVGGDYCDFVDCDNEGFVVVLGDVSGSDIDAAEYTLMGKHVIRAYAKESASASEVLYKSNRHIHDVSAPEVFISAFYGNIQTEKMIMTYASAGCEPALLYRESSGKVLQLRTEGMVLGLFAEAQFQEETIDLEHGDILVLVTDGITEAGSGNDRFGVARVSQILSKTHLLPAQSIAENIHKETLHYMGNAVPDDQGVIVIKIF